MIFVPASGDNHINKTLTIDILNPSKKHEKYHRTIFVTNGISQFRRTVGLG